MSFVWRTKLKDEVKVRTWQVLLNSASFGSLGFNSTTSIFPTHFPSSRFFLDHTSHIASRGFRISGCPVSMHCMRLHIKCLLGVFFFRGEIPSWSLWEVSRGNLEKLCQTTSWVRQLVLSSSGVFFFWAAKIPYVCNKQVSECVHIQYDKHRLFYLLCNSVFFLVCFVLLLCCCWACFKVWGIITSIQTISTIVWSCLDRLSPFECY